MDYSSITLVKSTIDCVITYIYILVGTTTPFTFIFFIKPRGLTFHPAPAWTFSLGLGPAME